MALADAVLMRLTTLAEMLQRLRAYLVKGSDYERLVLRSAPRGGQRQADVFNGI